MNGNEEVIATSRLIELARKRGLVDSAEKEGSCYRVNIGAATFLLDPEGTHEFLVKLLRGHTVRGDGD